MKGQLTCPCGQCDGGKLDQAFLSRLQLLEADLATAITVTSGFRCPAHNAAVGGEPDSLHLQGRATDVAVPDGKYRWRLVSRAIARGFLGLGIAANYVHIDDRGRQGDTVPWPVIWHYYRKAAPLLRIPRAKIQQFVRPSGPLACQ